MPEDGRDKTLTIRRAFVKATGVSMCDGCLKEIASGTTFIKWYAAPAYEEIYECDFLDSELHSHDRRECIGNTIRALFE